MKRVAFVFDEHSLVPVRQLIAEGKQILLLRSPMADISRHPTIAQAYVLVQSLEIIEAHEENTEIVLKAGKLMDEIAIYVEKYRARCRAKNDRVFKEIIGDHG